MYSKSLNSQLLFILLLVIVVISCSKSPNARYANIIKKWDGKEIILPKIKPNNVEQILPVDFKIVTRIKGDCYPCLAQLKLWNSFINKILKERKILFNFYIVISDTLMYRKINEKELHFDYPVIFDLDDQFKKLNKLENNDVLQTFLLDQTNKVIVIGNPINNPKLEELYIQTIKTYKYD